MGVSGLDQILWLAGCVAELCLICTLLYRKEYKRFPIFLASVLFILTEEPLLFWIIHHRSTSTFGQASLLSSVLDSIFQLGVLAEIAYKVLRPNKNSLPRPALVVFAGLAFVAFSGALTWVLAHAGHNTPVGQYFFLFQRVNLVFAFLRLGLFAFITAFSQMLGITWRNHVIRLAAGLAFYSAVSLMVQLTLSHLSSSNHTQYEFEYSLLQHIQVISYTGALAFWVWSFLQKDAPRKEFTPQMERILVTLSKTVHRDRLSLTRSLGHK